MLEYTNNNTVKMSKPGRLAEKKGFISNHRSYRDFSSGFQACSISLEMLLEFNKRFQNLSDYHPLNHNCHIYHRSLVATAIQKKHLYNLRTGSTALVKALSSSDMWVELSPKASCRKDLIDADIKTKQSLKVWLQEDSSVCPVTAIPHNPDTHKVISAAGMQLSMEDMRSVLESLSQKEKELELAKQARKRADEERQRAEQAARELAQRTEKEARERADREVKELVEKEAKERREKESTERAAKEAADRAEKEAKERADREAKELAEKEARRLEAEAQSRALRESDVAAERAKREREQLAAEKAQKLQRENMQLGGVAVVISVLLAITAMM
jgi:hypothetical protein